MKPLFTFLLLLFVIDSPGAELVEDFSTTPASRSWKHFGATTLFAWNPEQQNLEVTWDSSQTNSYFYYKLPAYLTRNDSFFLSLDVQFHDIEFGSTPGKPYTFPLAFGFINTTNAFDPLFFRGSGINPVNGPRNLLEFAYFPDSGFGATVAPTIVTESNHLYFSSNHPLELTTGDVFHVELRYDAPSQTLFTSITRNGEPFGLEPGNSIKLLVFPASNTDVILNAFAISSYSDAGQSPPQFAGSILAHAVIDNVQITWPDAPQINLLIFRSNDEIVLNFPGESRWIYTLEKSGDLDDWVFLHEITTTNPGTVQFTHSLAEGQSFYRVLARRAVVR